MPSLSALGKFKSSFNDIANEKNDVLSLKIPFDDLELPTTEPPPMDVSVQDDKPQSGAGDTPDSSFDFNAFLNDVPLGESPPPMDVPEDGALSALGDFLQDISSGTEETNAGGVDSPDSDSGQDDSLLDDFGTEVPGMDEISTDDFNMEDFGAENLGTSGEDFGAENIETGSPGTDDFNIDDLGTEDFDINTPVSEDAGADNLSAGDADFDLSGADDFGTEDFNFETPAAEDFHEEEQESIDLGGESPYLDPNAPEQPGDVNSAIDPGMDGLGTDAPGTDAQGSEAPEASSDFSMDDLAADDFNIPQPDSDFSGESLPDFDSGESPDSPLDNSIFESTDGLNDDFSFDSGGDDFNFQPETAEDSALPDLGDFGSDFDTDSIDLGGQPSAPSHDSSGESFSSDVFGGDDFSLPGLDDIFEKNKIDAVPAPLPPPKKGGLFGKKKAKAEDVPDAEDSVEEISLSQEDVDNLLKTLSAYPLNLRILCEELIAEQVILPAQLSKLIRLLINGAHVKETASHVEQITGKPVVIPKSFEKMTGAAFEEEQSSFAYIFIHNFLPVFRLFAFIAVVAASALYLGYQFIYKPIHAESLYRRGYERIPEGEYQRANELFSQAFQMHRKKKWFYLYAEAFITQRRFTLAENKYAELLRYYPRDKKGVLDYAALNTYLLYNFEKANRLLQRELLDYAPNDFEGLLAAGDNFLAWADSDPERFYDRYEDARFSYARLLELRGWQPPILERMLKYFIRTDNLREVLSLRNWFESLDSRRLSTETLAELGGYLLDKQLERPAGVPDPYVENIESVRSMLLQAVMEDPYLPEPHYHLARYHNNLGNTYEERLTLENAIRAFDLAGTESIRRRRYRVDTHYRYANLLINNREFFPAEENVVRGIQLFEDFLSRNLISASPQLGQLYSLHGDLEYFVKTGDMQAALRNYQAAERLGYSPPEIQFRMGAAHYQLEEWRVALEYLFKSSTELPLNRRLLFALGNAAYQRGDFFAAQGYYTRLLDILEAHRLRLPVLLPNDNTLFLDTGERLMMARNNLGVVYEAMADQTGNRDYRTSAMYMYAESARAWDAITRSPEFMTRMRLTDSPGAPSINLGYLNNNNALRPNTNYRPQIFVRIDRDVLEPSRWEELIR